MNQLRLHLILFNCAVVLIVPCRQIM